MTFEWIAFMFQYYRIVYPKLTFVKFSRVIRGAVGIEGQSSLNFQNIEKVLFSYLIRKETFDGLYQAGDKFYGGSISKLYERNCQRTIYF